jgi:hypothetical protein
LVLYTLAVLAVGAAVRDRKSRSRFVSCVLAVFWLWMAIAYHWMYFSQINRAALVFGGLFAVQSVLFVWLGIIQDRLRFGCPRGWKRAGGIAVLAYGLVAYPILNDFLGHKFPNTPTFGLPCPTTIFTFGILWWLRPPVPIAIYFIPWLWAVIGGSAAFLLGVPQDLGLFAAGIVSVAQLKFVPGSTRMEANLLKP